MGATPSKIPVEYSGDILQSPVYQDPVSKAITSIAECQRLYEKLQGIVKELEIRGYTKKTLSNKKCIKIGKYKIIYK